MKQQKPLNRRERRALKYGGPRPSFKQGGSKLQALLDGGPYAIALLNVEETDPVVRQLQRAMTKPPMKALLDNPVPMHCWLYSEMLYLSLDNTAGWGLCLLLQNDDFHVNLRNGDIMVDLAVDGDPKKRVVARIPRADFDALMQEQDAVVSYHATLEDFAQAVVAAGYEVELHAPE